MGIVVDTNVIVSAFLWGGVPRRLLDAVEEPRIELFTSRALISELEDVLSREKFTAQPKTDPFYFRFPACPLHPARHTHRAGGSHRP